MHKMKFSFFKNPAFHSHVSSPIKVNNLKNFYIYLAFLISECIQFLHMILYRKDFKKIFNTLMNYTFGWAMCPPYGD